MERNELNAFKAVVIDDIGGYEYEVYNKADVDDVLDTMEARIKELEADKLRQENYCESLVNENKRLNEIIISKDMIGAELVNESKELKSIAEKQQKLSMDRWFEIKALKARIAELESDLKTRDLWRENYLVEQKELYEQIKELEASQPNEYKEEKYFYTRLVNWLDKNEKGRVNPHHESGCPAIFKELTTKAQNEWKELADKLPKAPKSED